MQPGVRSTKHVALPPRHMRRHSSLGKDSHLPSTISHDCLPVGVHLGKLALHQARDGCMDPAPVLELSGHDPQIKQLCLSLVSILLSCHFSQPLHI